MLIYEKQYYIDTGKYLLFYLEYFADKDLILVEKMCLYYDLVSIECEIGILSRRHSTMFTFTVSTSKLGIPDRTSSLKEP